MSEKTRRQLRVFVLYCSCLDLKRVACRALKHADCRVVPAGGGIDIKFTIANTRKAVNNFFVKTGKKLSLYL